MVPSCRVDKVHSLVLHEKGTPVQSDPSDIFSWATGGQAVGIWTPLTNMENKEFNKCLNVSCVRY